MCLSQLPSCLYWKQVPPHPTLFHEHNKDQIKAQFITWAMHPISSSRQQVLTNNVSFLRWNQIATPELEFRQKKMTSPLEVRQSIWIVMWTVARNTWRTFCRQEMVWSRTGTRKESLGLSETCRVQVRVQGDSQSLTNGREFGGYLESLWAVSTVQCQWENMILKWYQVDSLGSRRKVKNKWKFWGELNYKDIHGSGWKVWQWSHDQ